MMREHGAKETSACLYGVLYQESFRGFAVRSQKEWTLFGPTIALGLQGKLCLQEEFDANLDEQMLEKIGAATIGQVKAVLQPDVCKTLQTIGFEFSSEFFDELVPCDALGNVSETETPFTFASQVLTIC
jgi:hypothetical protein